jgi:hypothetical protein
MKRTVIALAALTMLLPLGARTNAQDTNAPAHPGHRPGELLPPPIVSMLALTPDQQSQYETLKTQYQVEREAWIKAHKPALDQIQTQMQAARQANDTDKMKDLREQQHEAMKPLYDLRKQYIEKLRDSLTDEQKSTLDKTFPQWKAGPGHPTPAG